MKILKKLALASLIVTLVTVSYAQSSIKMTRQLIDAIEKANEKSVETLLTKEDVNNFINSYIEGHTPLLTALFSAQQSPNDRIRMRIFKKVAEKADVNKRDLNSDLTPLMWACLFGNAEMTRTLLRRKANVTETVPIDGQAYNARDLLRMTNEELLKEIEGKGFNPEREKKLKEIEEIKTLLDDYKCPAGICDLVY